MIISHHHSSSIIIHHPPLSVFVNHHYSVLSTTHCSPISSSTTLFDCLVIIHHQTSTCHNPWTFSFIQNPSEFQITNHFQTSHNAFQRRIYIKSYEIKKRSGSFTASYKKTFICFQLSCSQQAAGRRREPPALELVFKNFEFGAVQKCANLVRFEKRWKMRPFSLS